MINTLLKELRGIALEILDQGNEVDVVALEEKVRALQKQLTILEHEQFKQNLEVEDQPKSVVEQVSEKIIEPSEVIEEKPQKEATSFENLFTAAISDPVFVKKEDPIVEAAETIEVVPKNLNEVLGRGLKVGLNDRLAFIKNLFDESPDEYQRVIAQILTYDNLEEAQNFIENFVKPEYNFWEGKESYEERFFKIVEQNFN